MSNLLLIRADANTQMGTGHVMRCLALAEVWIHSGGRVLLASVEVSPAIQERVLRLGAETGCLQGLGGSAEEGAELIRLAKAKEAAWVVVDGYQFGADYQKRIKDAGLKLLVLDDYGHSEHYYADLVLNQNLGASSELYARREAYTRMLLGTRFVLLRNEFDRWHHWERTVSAKASNLLVTLGGSDPENVTLKIVEALRRVSIRPLDATVVAGGSNPHWASLEAAVQDFPFPIRLLKNVSDMPELMSEADLAFAAGGTTVWEMAHLGLPMLLVALAENQVANTEQLSQAGVAVNLGWHADLSAESIGDAVEGLLLDEKARKTMAERARNLVDGYGSLRVWLHLNEQHLNLRRAQSEDCRLLWEWANEQEVRAVSFSQEPIPWENHVKWFEARRQDPRCFLWIVMNEQEEALGQVRFDQKENQSAVVSISLGRAFRGNNRGALTIHSACRKLFAETEIERVDALIKSENAASQRAFQKAGFEKVGTTTINNHPALIYQLRKAECCT